MFALIRTSSRYLILGILMTVSTFAQTARDRAAIVVDYEAARLESVVTAVRITEAISLDGVLDEAAWALATPATDFVQRRPNPGALSAENTEARFLFDEDNLYVGVICYDSDAENIVVNELEEDFGYVSGDIFTLAIDSLHNLQSSFLFVTNPAGAKADLQASPGVFNSDWDGVWDVQVRRNSEGWIAEFVIPFKTLRFSNATSQEWGINMNRNILRINEESDWSPFPVRFDLSRVSQHGTLQGLENIRQGRNLKVTPFVTAGLTQSRPSDDPFAPYDRDYDYDGGVDLKYSLTPSLTLDATYRTDFAQVEVDRQQVNLTRFNLFFPEKRDFFLENAGTFAFGQGNNLVPFFSRRIGLSSQGTPTPIVGGARVTGQVGPYDAGFLVMKTERQDLTPSNNYVVGRLKRRFLTNSWVGGLVTDRESSVAGDYNRVYGVDAHLQFYQRLEFDSFILRSDTPSVSGRNQARQFEVAWRDDELTLAAGYNEIQTNFNPEVGFVRRANNTHYRGDVSWNPLFENNLVVRNLILGTEFNYYEDGATEQIETREERLNLGIRFENNGTVNFRVIQTFDRLLEQFPIHSSVAIRQGDYHYLSYAATASSNPGGKISVNGLVEWGEFWSGRRRSFIGGVSWKPNVHFSMNVDYTRNQVNLAEGDFTSDLVGARFLYAFSPRAFFNAFIQYNADTRQLSSNVRFNIIHHPLSDLFLVYNELRDTQNGQLLQRGLVFKLTNLFNF
jgi:hypothetical protein